ncbi:MAG: chemotaxis protein CheW [Rehaibacterium terrae]|uniref:chemotaxis protein CheW n=1 Tax=Rehaibacterium terrae TaxID=1341696 RepID=UPI0039189509
MSATQADIRGVLIAVTEGRLLLPNASVAEVITFAEPEAVPGAPDWLLGRIPWQGWRLPVLSFARLAGLAGQEREYGAKVVVIKALGGHPKLPYFALLTQGFPRLVTVSETGLLVSDDGRPPPLGVRMRTLYKDEPVLIPDLDSIELLIRDALDRAA